MFHKVLVATGGSPWSDRAVEYAIGLAKDYALELVILHVIADTPPYFIAEAGTSMDQVLEGNEEVGKHVIAEAARWAAEAGVAPIDTKPMTAAIAYLMCVSSSVASR